MSSRTCVHHWLGEASLVAIAIAHRWSFSVADRPPSWPEHCATNTLVTTRSQPSNTSLGCVPLIDCEHYQAYGRWFGVVVMTPPWIRAMPRVTLWISATIYSFLALVFATIPATLWQIVGSRVALVVPSDEFRRGSATVLARAPPCSAVVGTRWWAVVGWPSQGCDCATGIPFQTLICAVNAWSVGRAPWWVILNPSRWNQILGSPLGTDSIYVRIGSWRSPYNPTADITSYPFAEPVLQKSPSVFRKPTRSPLGLFTESRITYQLAPALLENWCPV
jgi:hypothetical protein